MSQNEPPGGGAFLLSRTDAHPASARLVGRLLKKALLFAALACAATALVALAHVPASLAPRADPFSVTAPDAEFYRKLNLSQGPHPLYQVRLHSAWGMPARTDMPDQAVYPLSAVPDGCAFFRSQFTGVSFGFGGSAGPTCVFERVTAGIRPPAWEMTRYNGRFYQRTWIRRGDIVRLAAGDALDLYPTPFVPDTRGLTPLTLAVGSHPVNCYTGSARNTYRPCFQDTPSGAWMQIPAGAKAAWDGHAWEDFPSFPPQQYEAPAWDKEPGVFVADRPNNYDVPGFDASSEVEPLQAVPNGRPVHCSSFTLDQMLHAYPYAGTIAQVLVDARPTLDRPWTVIKLGGRAYLRGWIADRPARPLPPARDLAVSSDTRAPEFVNPPAQVTLPLEGLIWRQTDGGGLPTPDNPGTGGKVTVSNVRLDRRAWDKW